MASVHGSPSFEAILAEIQSGQRPLDSEAARTLVADDTLQDQVSRPRLNALRAALSAPNSTRWGRAIIDTYVAAVEARLQPIDKAQEKVVAARNKAAARSAFGRALATVCFTPWRAVRGRPDGEPLFKPPPPAPYVPASQYKRSDLQPPVRISRVLEDAGARFVGAMDADNRRLQQVAELYGAGRWSSHRDYYGKTSDVWDTNRDFKEQLASVLNLAMQARGGLDEDDPWVKVREWARENYKPLLANPWHLMSFEDFRPNA